MIVVVHLDQKNKSILKIWIKSISYLLYNNKQLDFFCNLDYNTNIKILLLALRNAISLLK